MKFCNHFWWRVTNGLALTPRRFEALLQAGLHSMSVSLDGLEENHNWMRGNAQSFSKASQAIDLLVGEPSVAYDVITCVTEHNYEELPRLRDFLIAKGVRDWRLLTVVPMGRAAADAELGLTDAHFRGLMEFIKTTRREGSIRAEYGCEGYLGAYEFDVRDHAFVCSAGVTIGSVLIDGSISACTSIRSDYHQGNIYQDDFIDVWEHRFAAYRTDEWKRTGVCASCNAFRYCRGNGMHLRRGDGSLMVCHLKRLEAE